MIFEESSIPFEQLLPLNGRMRGYFEAPLKVFPVMLFEYDTNEFEEAKQTPYFR